MLSVAPLQIGALRVEFPVILAPMAGYTDSAMRSLCMDFGCGMVYTEVAVAEGVARRMPRTMHLFEARPTERPIAAHMYGANPDAMAQAAQVAESLGRFDTIDINCGCPMRKIVAKGAGAALTRNPARIEAIVRAVRSAVSLPVTIKTRVGFSGDQQNGSEIAHAAESGGAAAIAIHARVATNRHSGAADWEALARIKSERRIPVIGNGGVERAEDAVRMFRETGVDGVMIGRAAVGRPWLFDDIRRALRGEPPVEIDGARLREVVADQLNRLVALKQEEYKARRRHTLSMEMAAVLHFRGHLYRYLAGRPRWPEERRRFGELHTVADVLAMVDRVLA